MYENNTHTEDSLKGLYGKFVGLCSLVLQVLPLRSPQSGEMYTLKVGFCFLLSILEGYSIKGTTQEA